MMKARIVLLTMMLAILAGVGCRFEDPVLDAVTDESVAKDTIAINDVGHSEDLGQTENDVPNADEGAEGDITVVDGATYDLTAEVDTVEVPLEVAPDAPIVVTGPANFNSGGDLTPIQVHATWEGDPSTSVTLQWRTSGEAPESYVPRVWLVKAEEVEGGADASMPLSKAHVIDGTGFTYEAFYTDGMTYFGQWTVTISGLEPDTEYRYRAGTWDAFDPANNTLTGAELSEVRTIKTMPAHGNARPLTFVSAGDSRSGTSAIAANMPRLVEIPADFWLFNGDMTDVGDEAQWEVWFKAMDPVLARRSMMPVQGNHEMIADLFYWKFALPIMPTLATEFQEHGWSVNFGNVHIVGMDSNSEYYVEGQRDWLEQDLATASADPNIHWKIIMYHHPAYSASPKHGSTLRVIDYWVPIFEKYNVDLTFSGHDHDYERTKPIRGDQVVSEQDGVVYVVAGGFYSPGYSNGYDWWTETSAHGDKSNYCVVNVNQDILGNPNPEKLSMIVYSGDGGEVLDQLELSRKNKQWVGSFFK